MSLLVISLVCILFFGVSALMVLNYMMYLWQSRQIENLASQVKQQSTDKIFNKNSSYEFTSMDMSSSVDTKNLNKGIVLMKPMDNSFWLELQAKISILSKNSFSNFKKFLDYLTTLTTPPKKNQTEKSLFNNSSKENLINKLKPTTKTKPFVLDDLEEEIDLETDNINENLQTQVADDKKIIENQTNKATINIASDKEEEKQKKEVQDQAQQDLFAKLETKILENLRNSGLGNYSSWLELGALYEKYNKKSEAMEIYALVLKHSEGKEKDLARDKLIALS
jgi:hypothetical protein